MEYIIGIIVGGIITGLAMILNSFFNDRIARQKEQREYRRIHIDKDISNLESIYEDTLHSLDKLIRDKGRTSESELEKFYRLGIQLRLKSNEKIYDRFKELQNGIVNMAKSIPALPEEFIPQFEDDEERKYRLEKRKKAETKRDEEAKKYTGKLYQEWYELSSDMENHLAEIKAALTVEEASTRKA